MIIEDGESETPRPLEALISLARRRSSRTTTNTIIPTKPKSINMAQEEKREITENEIVNVNSRRQPNNNKSSGGNGRSDGGGRSFKFNADAAEFVPRSYSYTATAFATARSSSNNTNSPTQMNLSTTGYFYPYVQFLQDTHAHWDPDHHLPPNWFYPNPNPNPSMLQPPSPLHMNHTIFNNNNNNKVDAHSSTSPRSSDDFQQKIIKQVEYLFSDLSLMTNDTMAKHVNKDPEGYVPVAVIASMKKIKALVTDHHSLIHPLRSSTKLVVSKDSKKVKRRIPFTENYRDDLQCRTVMVENLPDDHSYQNLDKIFKVVGSVKAIRLCHPPEANPCRCSKNEGIISNKLHALVEYENAEMAERAAEKLNDERNWRRGMRVKVMVRRSPKSVLKNRKSDFDMLTDEEEGSYAESPSKGAEIVIDNSGAQGGEESSRKAAGHGRGGRIKTKGGRNQNNDRGLGLLLSSPPPTPTTPPAQCAGSSPLQMQSTDSISKHRGVGLGPRMPDGTRGFTMGRGKPLLPLLF